MQYSSFTNATAVRVTVGGSKAVRYMMSHKCTSEHRGQTGGLLSFIREGNFIYILAYTYILLFQHFWKSDVILTRHILPTVQKFKQSLVSHKKSIE